MKPLSGWIACHYYGNTGHCCK